MKTGWGQRLRETRGTATQRDFAKDVGVSLSVWIDYEKETRFPRFDTLAAVSEKTGYSIDWISSGRGDKFGGINQSVLMTAITAANKIVESQSNQGKGYAPDQVTKFIVDIYASMIKEVLAGKQSSVQDASSTTGDDDDGNRKESA